MKIIDSQGRLFGKINILDFIAIAIILLLIVLSSMKILNKDLSDLSAKDEIFTIEVKTSVIMDKGYFDVVKVGDTLGEMKHYLDATIKDIEILPVEVLEKDENGNIIKTVDPYTEKAIITFEAKSPYKNNSYTFGKQELRQGKSIFLESDLYRYKVQIISLKVVS